MILSNQKLHPHLANLPDIEALQREIQLRQSALQFKENLPHIFGQKCYPWQRKYIDSRHKINVLCAANQTGKSASGIKKNIGWGTDVELWPKLWKTTPIQFWYLYPDGGTATAEFETKWVTEFLPRGDLERHPIYGWKHRNRGGDIDSIRFNSGVTIFFKTYSQSVHNLQAGSAHMITADEEIPVELLPEIQMRTRAYDGYLNFLFTATRGQEFWRRVIEEKGQNEAWKPGEVDILKMQISMYDCLFYEDGTPSTIWTADKIEETKRSMTSMAQIERRVYGKFIKDEGLAFPEFSEKQHLMDLQQINLQEGYVYAGVDYGSGTNHQSSICLLWTNKALTHGVIFDIWRGEKGIETTAGDVVMHLQTMLKKHGIKHPTQIFYDHSARDLKTVADRSNLHFESAEKGHDRGLYVVNSLFKMNMIQIMKTGDWEILKRQLQSVTTEDMTPAKKKYADDDAVDCFRYCVAKIPWNITDLKDKKPIIPTTTADKLSRHAPTRPETDPNYSLEQEIQEWNSILSFAGTEDYLGDL